MNAPRTRLLLARLRLRGARFVILRHAGGTRTAFGAPTPRFVRACNEILQRAGYEQAWVAQLGSGARARLHFAEHLDEACRQRIRNAWEPPPPPCRHDGARVA